MSSSIKNGKHGEGHLYQKRGKGSWRVRWMFNGKLHDESTGTTDLEQARNIAKQKTSAHAMLGDVRTLTARLEKAKDEQTFLEAKTNPSLNLFRMIEAFKSCDIIRRKKNADRTIAGWSSMGNLLIDRFGGNTEMRQLTKTQIEEFMREYETKVSAAQFNHALQFFKRVWDVLKKYDSPTELKARLHEESPWAYVLPMKRGEVVGKKPFTKEQLIRIWRVLDEMKNPDLTLLFDLARNTGARLHDLVSWKWDEHLKFNTREDGKMEAILEWKPLKTANSTGKIMVIPVMDDRVVSELWRRYNNREAGQEYILPSMLEMYNHNKACQLTKLCQSVFIKAGIQTKVKVEGNSRSNCVYGIHSFRHTLVSELFQKGVDLGTIQHLYTGHGSSYMTELYAKADMDKKRIDLSNLSRIETKMNEPSRIMAELMKMNESDKKAFDEIETMDAPKPVKIFMRSMLQFKSKKDLMILKGWLDRRIEGMK